MVGGSDRNWMFRITGYEPLVAWDRDWTGKVIPNLAEEFSGNADATEFTFKLRKGLKWSDGQPFTSDDVGFFVNDIAQQQGAVPQRRRTGWWSTASSASSTKVDDQTFKIKFAEPYGLFLQRLASVYGVQIDMMAKHYCSQFMPGYNKDEPRRPRSSRRASRAGPNSSSRNAASTPRPMSAGRIPTGRSWSPG